MLKIAVEAFVQERIDKQTDPLTTRFLDRFLKVIAAFFQYFMPTFLSNIILIIKKITLKAIPVIV